MAQFDVYRFEPPGAPSQLVVNLQFGLFDLLGTRIVAPLYPLGSRERPIQRLNPLVQIEGERYYLSVQEIAAVKLSLLGAKVASLESMRDEIISALDFILTGV